jgi:glutamyl-Q tRNA(Asp) synthetase
MIRPVFRFAPSPNGLLHLGHAYSALLNVRMAEEMGGRLLLRIEDTDETRARPEFTAAILEDLAWLGLSWEQPVRVQSEHFSDYDQNIGRLWSMGAVYPCFCSRRQAQTEALPWHDPEGQPHYGGTCRKLTHEEAERRISRGDTHGWRLDTSRDRGASVWGDALIAKRHVGSSYHIAVVTDDALQQVSHVVRGMDIEASTPLHVLIQRLLGLPTPIYHHHRLILDDSGEKLSKSRHSTSLRHLREAGATAHDIRKRLGFA